MKGGYQTNTKKVYLLNDSCGCNMAKLNSKGSDCFLMEPKDTDFPAQLVMKALTWNLRNFKS